MASEDISISYMRADKSTYRQGKPIMGTALPLTQPSLAFSLRTVSILGSAAEEDVDWLFIYVKGRP